MLTYMSPESLWVIYLPISHLSPGSIGIAEFGNAIRMHCSQRFDYIGCYMVSQCWFSFFIVF